MDLLRSFRTFFIFPFFNGFKKGNCKLLNTRKAIFITGCDSGLGFNFALNLHSKNIKVLAGVHNISSKGAQALRHKEIYTVEIDVTDIKSIIKAYNEIIKWIDCNNYELCGVINNAGSMVVGEVEWLTHDMLDKQIAVNLLGPIHLIKIFLPTIRKYKCRILNVTSHCSRESLPGMTVYSASKAGLAAFSQGLQRELDKFHIPVIQFVPGSYVTESCIMSKQAEYNREMEENMSAEVKDVYSEYFSRYTGYLDKVVSHSKSAEPALINDPPLYAKLESALFSPTPSRVYVNQPQRYFFYYTLFSLLPNSKLKDFFIKKFIMMPEWNK